jgi:hypothetical protein
MSYQIEDKVARLERHILNLGTELYLIKQDFFSFKKTTKDTNEFIEAIKLLLEEKHLISVDDIEATIQVIKDNHSEKPASKIKSFI